MSLKLLDFKDEFNPKQIVDYYTESLSMQVLFHWTEKIS